MLCFYPSTRQSLKSIVFKERGLRLGCKERDILNRITNSNGGQFSCASYSSTALVLLVYRIPLNHIGFLLLENDSQGILLPGGTL